VIVAKHKAVENTAAMGRTISVATVLGVLVGIAFAVLFSTAPRWCLGLMGAPESLMAEVYTVFRTSNQQFCSLTCTLYLICKLYVCTVVHVAALVLL
jgi:Na+-driven multidrug efflux pump